MLSDQQRQQFFERGYLQLKDAVDGDAVTLMRDHIWDELNSQGVLHEDRCTWPDGHAAQLTRIRKRDPNPLENDALRSAISELLSRDWKLRPDWGQALVTFPFNPPWRVPGGNWHLDHQAFQPGDHFTGVNVFLLLNDLETHGGGTVVLEHSPGLVARFNERHPELRTAKMAGWKKVFRASNDYLKRLTNKNDQSPTDERNAFFMDQETIIDEVPLRVSEIVGAAGDIIICHPQLLHASPIANARDVPRMMRTLRVYW